VSVLETGGSCETEEIIPSRSKNCFNLLSIPRSISNADKWTDTLLNLQFIDTVRNSFDMFQPLKSSLGSVIDTF